METITEMQPLFTAIIAFVAVLTGLGFIFNLLLNPVKEQINGIKGEINDIKGEINDIKREFQDLKSSHASLNHKLDQLLSRS